MGDQYNRRIPNRLVIHGRSQSQSRLRNRISHLVGDSIAALNLALNTRLTKLSDRLNSYGSPSHSKLESTDEQKAHYQSPAFQNASPNPSAFEQLSFHDSRLSASRISALLSKTAHSRLAAFRNNYMSGEHSFAAGALETSAPLLAHHKHTTRFSFSPSRSSCASSASSGSRRERAPLSPRYRASGSERLRLPSAGSNELTVANERAAAVTATATATSPLVTGLRGRPSTLDIKKSTSPRSPSASGCSEGSRPHHSSLSRAPRESVDVEIGARRRPPLSGSKESPTQ